MIPWIVTMRAYNGAHFTVRIDAHTATQAREQAEAWCDASDHYVRAEPALDGPALGLQS